MNDLKKAVLFALVCAWSIWPGPPASASDWNLVMLVTSDIEGQLEPFTVKSNDQGRVRIVEVGGAGRLAWAMNRAREKYPDMTLTVSSGDDLMGPYFTNFEGRPIYEVMNALGYDAGAWGNHEFDQGDAFLARALEHCRFPIVESNLQVGPDSPLSGRTRPYLVLERGGLKIGIFGLLNSDLALISKPGPDTAVLPDHAAVARRMTDLLLDEHQVDLVVALAHIGLQNSRQLVRLVPEIGVVCVGNAVTLVEQGRELVRQPDGRVSLVVQTGEKGEYLGMLKLRVEHGEIAAYHWQPLHLDARIPEEPTLTDLVEKYRSQLPRDRVLAQSKTPLDIRKKSLRTGEAPLGSLVADILRERYKTDLVLYNGGGIRGNKVLPPGPIKSSDLDAMFPFQDRVVILKASGRTVRQALERGVASLPEAGGHFLQVSGLKYTININQPPQELQFNGDGKALAILHPGRRVATASTLGPDGDYRTLDDEASYTLATNQFLAEGGDGFIMFKNVAERTDTDTLVREVVAEGLQAREVIAPQSRGRIDFVRD